MNEANVDLRTLKYFKKSGIGCTENTKFLQQDHL